MVGVYPYSPTEALHVEQYSITAAIGGVAAVIILDWLCQWTRLRACLW